MYSQVESQAPVTMEAVTAPAEAVAVRPAPPERERAALPDFWSERCLTSPLHGAMVHVVEGMGLLVGADVVAGRLFRTPDKAPCAYVGTPGLEATPNERTSLQQWPLAEGSIFGLLERKGVVDQPVPVHRLMVEEQVDSPEAAFLTPLHPACRLTDAFAVPVAIEGGCWGSLLLMRQCRRPPFTTAECELAMGRRKVVRDALMRGLHALRPAETSLDDLLARLSRTERDVLARLQESLTERQVALRLGRSPHTVHVHVKNIYRKLAVRSRQQLQHLLESASASQVQEPVESGTWR